jgi:hypothetical protein
LSPRQIVWRSTPRRSILGGAIVGDIVLLYRNGD